MKNLALFTFFISSLLISFGSKANDVITSCDNCTSGVSYTNKANSAALQDEDLSQAISKKVYILNGEENEAKVYSVTSIPAEPGLPAQTIISESSPTSSEQYALDEAIEQHKRFRDAIIGDYTVPGSISNSSFGIVDSEIKNAAIDDYRQSRSLLGIVRDYRGAILNVASNYLTDTSVATATFKFEDGSTAIFDVRLTIDSTDIAADVKLKIVKALDKNGKEINFDDLGNATFSNGTYTVESSVIDEFLEAASIAGVPIGDPDDFTCDTCTVTITDE